jgi:DNA sulfur modification protein DndD
MKIRNVTLTNFRTFYGTTKIEFSTDSERPTTIFIGENGAGKTTVLNAIYWAFTGGFTEQFSDSSKLVNKDAKQEGTKKCSVAIEFDNEFSNGEDRYLLIREKFESNSGSEITLQKINTKGAYEGIQDGMADIVIERFIPKRLANWFIFDGEAMRHMHLNGDPKFKDELSQTFGFTSMSQLIKILDQIDADYKREEQKLIKSDELDELSSEIERLIDSVGHDEKRLKNLATTISQEKRKVESLEQKLTNLPQSEPIQGQRERASRRLVEAKAKRTSKERERNHYISITAPKKLLENGLQSLIQDFLIKEEKQILPQPFGTQLIADILEKGECICGTKILAGSHEAACLAKKNESATTGQLQARIFSFRSEISNYLNGASEFQNVLDKLAEDIGIYEGEVADQEQIIEQADKKIADIPDEEIQKIKVELHSARDLIEISIRQQGEVQGQLDGTKRQIAVLKARQESILAQQTRTSHLRVEREKVCRLGQYVLEQNERQQNEVLDVLNKEVSGMLVQYLTKNFTAEVDANNYAVRTYDVDHRLTGLSTGETNVLKFAVIAAIVGMAGNRTTLGKVSWISEPITAPLIFDAPFSVVDSEYRTSVATNLAKLASQLVLLFDSAKWDQKLEELMSPKVGKIYLLVSNAKGNDKSTFKNIIIKNNLYELNRYKCDRDETILTEVQL